MRNRLLLAAGLSILVLLGLVLPSASEPQEPTLRFSAAGDFGSTVSSRAVFAQIGELGNDLHLALGDLSYGAAGAEEAWCDLVKAGTGAGYPFELLAGNHESDGSNGNINDFSACLPNQLPGLVGTYGRQFYVDVPAHAPLVRFVMISPGIAFTGSGTWSYSAGTPRYAWTAAAIDGARAAGVPWVVVGMHKPCLSVGGYPCDSGADLTNLLLEKKVDLVLSGHEHQYARSKQIARGPGCPVLKPGVYEPACVADSDPDLVRGAGTVLSTVGTGGVGLRDVFEADPELPYFAATSGANQNPTYGVLDIELTADVLSAQFRRAAGGTFTDGFTIRRSTDPAPPPNAAPSALFTSSAADLQASFDATESTDPDGVVTGYAWDFGDGSTGVGATPSHTYDAPGTYTVRLTVTDDDAVTGTTTRAVTVTAPPAGAALAEDAFGRSVAGGWGSAQVGGPWRVSGRSSSFSVTDGSGRILMHAPGTGPSAALDAVSSLDTDARVDFAVDKPITGGGVYLTLVGRRVDGANDYRAMAKARAGGAVQLYLVRKVAGAETTLVGGTVSGLTLGTGEALTVRMQTTGTAPTTLRAKVWKAGSAEPAGWQLTTTDGTSPLQDPGAVGVMTYLSGSATNAPVTARVDDLVAVPVG